MRQSAIIVGVSSLPGLGHSIAKKFAMEGMKVGIVGRRAERLERAKNDIEAHPGVLHGVCATRVCDAGQTQELHEALNSMVQKELADCRLSCLVFNASSRPFPLTPVVETPVERIAADHRTSALGFVSASQWAVPIMQANEGGGTNDTTKGTIILTGATASLRGSKNFGSFCQSKSAARSLCMSMAKELVNDGIHVAHVIVDGMVAIERENGETPSGGRFMDPDAIADSYIHLFRQPRSCLTFEMDARPHEVSQW